MCKIFIIKKAFDELMEQNNLSIYALANKIGFNRTSTWKILNDKANVGERFIACFLVTYPQFKFEQFFFAKRVNNK